MWLLPIVIFAYRVIIVAVKEEKAIITKVRAAERKSYT